MPVPQVVALPTIPQRWLADIHFNLIFPKLFEVPMCIFTYLNYSLYEYECVHIYMNPSP